MTPPGWHKEKEEEIKKKKDRKREILTSSKALGIHEKVEHLPIQHKEKKKEREIERKSVKGRKRETKRKRDPVLNKPWEESSVEHFPVHLKEKEIYIYI